MSAESTSAPKRFFVDPALCTASEACVHCAPGLFKMSERGYAEVVRQPVTPEELERMETAIEGCPTAAIIDRERKK